MFECIVTVFLPLCLKGESNRLGFKVAKFGFDPGLKEGDLLYINDATFIESSRDEKPVASSEPKFSFQAKVLERRYILDAGSSPLLTLELRTETADKESLPEIVSSIKSTFPGAYQDYQPANWIDEV